MKKIICTLLLISSISYSQLEKKLGTFHKVTSFDKIDVTLIKSDENKIIINGDKKEDVEVVNKNGELKIRMSFGNLLKGDNISATVYFSNIEALEANEGSRISSNDVLEGLKFNIIVKEGSQINVKLNADRLEAKVSQGATIHLEGNVAFSDILVNSGGIFEGENLITNQTSITANAGGQADVNASDLVDAKVRAGGSIYIFGNPKQINQKIVAGGTIEQAK